MSPADGEDVDPRFRGGDAGVAGVTLGWRG
jgi:hypothetical protein